MLTLDLTGKIAVVTGATGQLGRVITETLAGCGADVAIHWHSNEKKAHALQEQCETLGVRALCVRGDITCKDEVLRMRDEVHAGLGTPDILVCNAVIQYIWKNVLEQPDEDYFSQFSSCVMQNVYMAKAFLPAMIEKKGGRYIAVNTECAALAEAGCSAYTAGKRGLDGFIRCLAKEVGGYGITVNQVAPGWTVSYTDREKGSESQPEYEKTVPLGRRGTDAEIANMIAFLASELASFTTGAYIPVSGGRVMPAI